jgi:FkbM family methyltransferase
MNFAHKLFNKNQKLIRFFEKIMGARIFTTLPIGIDFASDIKYNLKNLKVKTIFDVGANIGESENYFSKHFKQANIYCFEPVNNSFNNLTINLKGKNTSIYNFGFGEFESILEIEVYKNPSLSSFNSFNIPIFKNEEKSIEKIEIKTITNFCKSNNIDRIDVLKIDTEGYDLKVLKGAIELLKNNKISIIQVEASMNHENTFHVYFAEFIDFLSNFNFEIFAIHDQILDFKAKKSKLRRINLSFINKNIL